MNCGVKRRTHLACANRCILVFLGKREHGFGMVYKTLQSTHSGRVSDIGLYTLFLDRIRTVLLALYGREQGLTRIWRCFWLGISWRATGFDCGKKGCARVGCLALVLGLFRQTTRAFLFGRLISFQTTQLSFAQLVVVSQGVEI